MMHWGAVTVCRAHAINYPCLAVTPEKGLKVHLPQFNDTKKVFASKLIKPALWVNVGKTTPFYFARIILVISMWNPQRLRAHGVGTFFLALQPTPTAFTDIHWNLWQPYRVRSTNTVRHTLISTGICFYPLTSIDILYILYIHWHLLVASDINQDHSVRNQIHKDINIGWAKNSVSIYMLAVYFRWWWKVMKEDERG